MNMRSVSGVAAAVILLLALPVAILCEMIVGNGGENVIHLALALGFAIVSVAVFDFRTPFWVTLTGSLGAIVASGIFLVQGVSDLTQIAWLQYLAYRVLGQWLESVVGLVFVFWCLGLLLTASEGRARVFGSAAVIVVLTTAIVVTGARTLDVETPGALKVLYLLLFAWLLVESRKPSPVKVPHGGLKSLSR